MVSAVAGRFGNEDRFANDLRPKRSGDLRYQVELRARGIGQSQPVTGFCGASFPMQIVRKRAEDIVVPEWFCL